MTAPRDHVRLAYWSAIGIVAAAMTGGLTPLFEQHFGSLFAPLLAMVMAVTIELLFTQALLLWRSQRGLMHLLALVVMAGISMVCDAPYLFRLFQGLNLTTQQFTAARDDAVRDVVVARERLAAAAESAKSLADYSTTKAQREDAAGDTCEKSTPGKGVRHQFRMDDAATFQQASETVAARSQRLNMAVSDLQALPPATGDALREHMTQLRAGLALAFGIVHDPALSGLADQLDARAQADDTVRHGRGGESFRCPDPALRDHARTVVAQLRSLPELKQQPVVTDFTDANVTLVALPTRLLRTVVSGVGGPGSMSMDDLVALVVSTMLEALVFFASWMQPVDRAIGQRLAAAQRAMRGVEAGDLRAFLALLSDPDPALCRLWAMLNRYRISLGRVNVVAVAHGTEDAQLLQLGRAMSVLSAIGWAHRYGGVLLLPTIWLLRWWCYPEMRRAVSCEYFTVRVPALDELNLAELLSRLRDDAAFAPRPSPRVVALHSAAE